MPGTPTVLHPGVAGLPLSGSDYNDNGFLIEQSFLDVGSFVVSGLALSAGTGLSVNVATGKAVIGAEITIAAPFVIGGLTNTTTNYLWLLQNGTGTSNTSGTQPASSAFLGIAVTAGGIVTSVTNAVPGLLYLPRSGFGHVIASGGPAPTAAAGGNNGAAPPAPVVVAGSNDARGVITFGSGTGAAAGDQVDVTFARPYATTPIILMTPLDNSLVDFQPTIGNRSTTGFSLFTKVILTSSQANTVYRFSYLAVQ